MSDRRLRTLLLLLCVVGVAVARALGVGRAKPAPDVSRHPSVDDGRRSLAPVADPPPAVTTPDRARVFEQPVASVASLPTATLAAGASETPTRPDLADPTHQAVLTPVAEPSVSADPTPVADPSLLADPTPAAGPSLLVEPGPGASWQAPVDGSCPDGYPVKAKLRSGIFHLPGMAAYERTTPDRCYPSAEAAVADGLRPAKR